MEVKDSLLVKFIEADLKKVCAQDYFIEDYEIELTAKSNIEVKSNEIVYIYFVDVTASADYSIKITSGLSAVQYAKSLFEETNHQSNLISKHIDYITIQVSGTPTFTVKYLKLKYFKR